MKTISQAELKQGVRRLEKTHGAATRHGAAATQLRPPNWATSCMRSRMHLHAATAAMRMRGCNLKWEMQASSGHSKLLQRLLLVPIAQLAAGRRRLQAPRVAQADWHSRALQHRCKLLHRPPTGALELCERKVGRGGVGGSGLRLGKSREAAGLGCSRGKQSRTTGARQEEARRACT